MLHNVWHPHPGRLQLEHIASSLQTVETHWREIDDELDRRGIGRKDTPFTAVVKMRMVSAFEYLDALLAQQMPPFSRESIGHMLALNERVHYGTDQQLRSEYAKAIAATAERFYQHIEPIHHWYEKHATRGNHPLKLAAEIYVSILGYPQLYIEGNHRTGSLIANWISVYHGFAPFVLSADNAIAYFAPSTEIKSFARQLRAWVMAMFMASRSSFQREEILLLSLPHHIFISLDKMLYFWYSLFRELKFIILPI
jgi:hypothetical protein